MQERSEPPCVTERSCGCYGRRGMSVAELCGLRLGDVDREERSLRVRRKGGQERWVPLSANGWFQLLSSVEQPRPKER